MSKDIKFYPLTKAQNSILIIEKFFPRNCFVNVCATVKIKKAIDFELLNESINLVIKQNDSLRTRIVKNLGEPLQYITEFQEERFELVDFSKFESSSNYYAWERMNSLKSFSFYDGKLYSFVMLRFGESEGGFYIKCHHIINDAWSTILFANQVLSSYISLTTGKQLEEINNINFQEYVDNEQKYISSTRFIKDRDFWQEIISKNIVPTLFEKRKTNNITAKRRSHLLPLDISSRLNEYCAESKNSPFIIFAALIALYFWKTKGRDTVVIGATFLNRSGFREKNTVGMFMNSFPFHMEIDESASFSSFLASLTASWMKVLRHGSYPYVNLLKEYREISKTNGKLYDVTLSFHNAKLDIQDIEYNTEWHFNQEEINPLCININDRENKGTYHIDYDYLVDFLDENDIDNIFRGMLSLLIQGLEKPSMILTDLSLLTRSEEQQILKIFNDTNIAYPNEKTIIQQFQEQARKTPDKVALVFEEDTMTYRALDIKSSQLAEVLKVRGVMKEEIVGLIVERSFDMVTGILGILKAGAAYLPIDPSYPVERISYMLANSKCRFVATNCSQSPGVLSPGIENLDLNLLELLKEEIDLDYLPCPSDLAYVIYTSGSTGLPKGVMIEHRALSNFVHSMNNIFGLPYKNIVSLTTLSFDIFFVETILPLLTGMTVIIASKAEANDPGLLLNLIEKHGVEMLQFTPSRLKTLINDSNDLTAFRDVSVILVGGEAFPENLLSRLTKITRANIYNMYGPTETTIWSTVKKLDSPSEVTIGRPVGNTQIYILDNFLRPLPIGTPGEIYISGHGLARGYYEKEELTEERFLANPFIPGTKMYKTGDLGKWLENGELQYISRNDNQVKIRGFRIELGEIEKCLLQIDGIKDAVVMSYQRKTDRVNLCAYLTGNSKVQVSYIRDYLSRYLPDYMMPARFIWLQDIPLTPNGKVDRKALPKPSEIEESLEVEYAAPRDYVEETLAKIWCEVLEIDKIGIDNDFFALGGDSLAVIEVLSSVIINDWKLSAQDIYEYPTIRKLSPIIKCRSNSQEDQIKEVIALDSEGIKQGLDSITSFDNFLFGNILLTGATGFLGIHILKELLGRFSGKVYCLVRGKDAKKKLYRLFQYYFTDYPIKILDTRIVIVPGDVSLKNFGLDEEDYELMIKEVSSVIHAAALVKHYGSYADFEKVNVAGTAEVINFCLKGGKSLSHISTMSVSGNYISGQSQNVNFTERDLYIGQDYKNNVYVRSKFEAECCVITAMKEGLKATILRVGILTGRESDGRFQYNIEENAFYRKIKSIFEIGYLPESTLEEYIEFTPVDSCATAIIHLLSSIERKLPIYHLFNHKRIQIQDFLDIISTLGITVKGISPKEFADMVVNMSSNESGKEIISGIVTDLIVQGGLSFSSNVNTDSSLTVDFLNKLGFGWPNLTSDYLSNVVNHMNRVGFFIFKEN